MAGAAAMKRQQAGSAQLGLELAPSYSTTDGTYPAFQTHSETSREAAAHVHRSGSAASQRARALAFLRRGLATIHEIAVHLGVVDGTASARVSELRLAGEIERTAFHRRNPSGVSAVLWRVRRDSMPSNPTAPAQVPGIPGKHPTGTGAPMGTDPHARVRQP
jgi:hypothetical protein